MLEKTNMKKVCLRAFTLAEVLITLVIIGIVAAITIPTLIQKQEEQQTVVALKKAYSTLSNAYNLAVKDDGTPDTWGLTGTTAGAEKMLGEFSPYLKILKNCETSSGCVPNYKQFNNDDYTNIDNSWHAKAQLADGTLLIASPYNSCDLYNWGDIPALQNVCGEFYVDVNGFKKPNMWGKDMFLFNLTKYGIIPAGTAQYNSAYTFNNCNSHSSGFGCSAWVIYNENMDYLHCSGLSWTGKTKCD